MARLDREFCVTMQARRMGDPLGEMAAILRYKRRRMERKKRTKKKMEDSRLAKSRY